MATIDEELGQMERDIRQLKIEYDQYFGGGRKRPPTEIRYNNLTQTYAKYKDIFRKKMQQKEEGRSQRHFGAAAKAIEAERAKKLADAPAPASQVSAATIDAALPQTAGFRMVCSEPENETEKVDQLYQALLLAKEKAGEEIGKLSPAGFKEFVRKKTKDLQEKQNCRDVEYVVEVVEGQVKLKALVKS
jgi:hypothetical protein